CRRFFENAGAMIHGQLTQPSQCRDVKLLHTYFLYSITILRNIVELCHCRTDVFFLTLQLNRNSASEMIQFFQTQSKSIIAVQTSIALSGEDVSKLVW